MARDQVRVEREAQQPQAVVEVVLPERRVELEQLLAAPDVVDEQVEPAVVGVDPLDERGDLRRVEVVDRDGDPLAAGRGDQLRGLLDRLRAVVPPSAARGCCGRCSRRCARLAERDRDAAPGAAGRAGDERDRRPASRSRGTGSTPRGAGGARAPAPPRARARRRAAGRRRASRRTPGRRAATVTTGSTVERIDAVVGPDAREAGEEQADRPDRRDDREAGEPAPAGRA